MWPCLLIVSHRPLQILEASASLGMHVVPRGARRSCFSGMVDSRTSGELRDLLPAADGCCVILLEALFQCATRP